MKPIIDEQDYDNQKFEALQAETGEVLRGQFNDCNFVNCNLNGVVLQNCRFSSCTFQNTDLSLAQLSGSAFPLTVFKKSKLIGLDWTQADWGLVGLGQLGGFHDCVLNHSTFIGLGLKGLRVEKCVCHEVDFREADLSGASFKGTDLTGSLFGNTDLHEADLSRARNYNIDALANNVKRARFALPEAMALLYSMDIELEGSDETAE